jgi:hypothetical protein
MASLLGSENVPDLSNKIGLSDNDKIRLWEEASRNLTGKNTYHVIHGDPKENASSSDRLYCVVPDNIIVVIMAPPDTVMYGNTLDDLEVAMYLKNPNWPKSVPKESIEPPKTGFELEGEDLRWTTWQGYDFPDEPDELKTFEEQLEWTEKEDAKAATFVETEGKKGILYGAQIFYPGDTIYDQQLSFDKNSTNFDSYYIGEVYNKKKLIDGGEKRYKDLLWKEVVWELAQMVGFKSYKEFQDTNMGEGTAKSRMKEDVYEFFYQMGSGSGIEMKRGCMKSKVTNSDMVPPVKELEEKFDKGLLEFSMLPINDEFNRNIHNKLVEKTRGNVVEYNTTCQIMKLWSDQAKGGTVIHYLNSCSPAIVRADRSRLTKQEEARALTGKNILRDRIFESGRNNLKYLRSRWRGHQDIPIQGHDELPRLYYGVFRYMSSERYDWYKYTMGTYFQQLKFENAIGHKGLQVLYKQAVRYDYSGMMRTKLQEAYKSAEKEHGFNSTNFTWFNSNPHWLDKGQPTQEAPHWEEGWISDSNWKGQEYFGKKTEYKKTSGVVGGSNQLAIGDIIWNGEDPDLLETWGDQAINYRRWYEVIDRNNEEPIILRLRRLNSDLSVWHSPDGAADEFDLNEAAALFNYKIYNVPDAPQAGGMDNPGDDEGEKMDIDDDEEKEGEKMEIEDDETKDNPNDEGYATTVPRGLSDYRSRHAQQYAEREEKKKKKEMQEKEIEDMKKDRTVSPDRERLPHNKQVDRYINNRGLNNLGTIAQRPHSYGPLPLQWVVPPPQPAYHDQLLPPTGSQMNNMYWDNPALAEEQWGIPEQQDVMWQDMNVPDIPYEVRNPDRPAADGGRNGLPLNAPFLRPSEEGANNENIRNEEVDIPNYDDWFAEQRDQFDVDEDQRENPDNYAAYYNSVLTMREYDGWTWQKFVCGCGSRRPNCGEDATDGPNFQWFLSNMDVRDPQHPAYRLSDDRGWVRLSILCTDDDGNTGPAICPSCKPVEQTLYNEIGPDVVTQCEAHERHIDDDDSINPSGVPFENYWAKYFWTHPEVVLDGVGEYIHRFSEMYSFNTPTEMVGDQMPQQCDNDGRVPWDPNFRPDDIPYDEYVIRVGEIQNEGDEHITEVGADEVVDNVNIIVSTGYQAPGVMIHTLNLMNENDRNNWNTQHPRGPHLDTYDCDWCNLRILVLHHEGEGSTQPLWDMGDNWDNLDNNDTICPDCSRDRSSVCKNCDQTFRMDHDTVYDGDEIYCDEECAAQARLNEEDEERDRSDGKGHLYDGGGEKPTKELVVKRLEIIIKKLPQIKNKKFWMEILKKVSAKKGGMVGEEEEDEGYKTDDTEEAEPGTAPQLPLAEPPEELIAAHQQTLQHQEDLIPQAIINSLQEAWNSFRFEADPEYNPEPLPPDTTYADLWDHILGSVFLLAWTLMNETINEQPHLRNNYRNYVVEFITLFIMLVLWSAWDRIIFNDTSDRTSQVRRYLNLMWLRWTPRVMRALLNFMLHPLEAGERFRELVAAMMINDLVLLGFMGGAETKNEDLKWEVNSYIKKREGDIDIYAKVYNADWGWIVAMPCDKEGVEHPGAHWEPDKWLEGKQGDLMMNGWRHYEIGQEGGGAIQSYFAGSEPQRDYTWNVAQFNGAHDDFGAAQHILELSMRYDDFDDEADHRRELQRRIIDAYHHPNRRVWETLLRWMRSRPIGVEQQVQQQRQPPPPGGQVAMPSAGGKRHKKKTQKRKRRKKKTRGRKKRKGSRKRKRRKNRTHIKKLKKRH